MTWIIFLWILSVLASFIAGGIIGFIICISWIARINTPREDPSQANVIE